MNNSTGCLGSEQRTPPGPLLPFIRPRGKSSSNICSNASAYWKDAPLPMCLRLAQATVSTKETCIAPSTFYRGKSGCEVQLPAADLDCTTSVIEPEHALAIARFGRWSGPQSWEIAGQV